MSHVVVYAALFLSSCIYALVRGGAPERTAAIILVAGNLLSIAVVRPHGVRFHTPELDLFLVDAAGFAALAVLTLLANRYWPLWMTAAQGTPVLFHAAVAASPAYVTPAYQISAVIWSYPLVTLLMVGTARHRLRLRKGLRERPWRDFSPILTPSAVRRQLID